MNVSISDTTGFARRGVDTAMMMMVKTSSKRDARPALMAAQIRQRGRFNGGRENEKGRRCRKLISFFFFHGGEMQQPMDSARDAVIY